VAVGEGEDFRRHLIQNGLAGFSFSFSRMAQVNTPASVQHSSAISTLLPVLFKEHINNGASAHTDRLTSVILSDSAPHPFQAGGVGRSRLRLLEAYRTAKPRHLAQLMVRAFISQH
jgi:hypothetical protein